MSKKQTITIIALMAVFAMASFGTVAQNDRATFGLKGNVSKVTQDENQRVYPMGRNDWMAYNLEFSTNGKLTKVNGRSVTSEYFNSEYALERDSQGRISKLGFVAGDGFQWVYFKYDDKGRVLSERYVAENLDEGGLFDIGNLKYYYDENDNVSKVVVYEGYDGTTSTATYKYESFDPSGNWIIRVVNCAPIGLDNHKEKRTLEY